MLLIGDIVKKTQPSLFWCMRSLPKPKREAIYTLFAFCRHIDNIINSNMPAAEKVELLNAWREELDNIYDKKIPATNIGRKIYKNCMRFNLPKEQWVKILDSAFLDVPHPLQAPEQEVFDKYIYGTAIVPFDLSLQIIGGSRASVRQELAKNLGQAVLITSILRDIKEDAVTQHVYLPREILQKANVTAATPKKTIENKNLAAAREELSKQAETSFAKAQRLLSKMNRKYLMPFSFIHNVSFCYFNMMKERGWDVISPKPKIGKMEKFKLIVKTLFS